MSEIVTDVEWTATTPAPSIVELPMLVEAMPGVPARSGSGRC